MVRQCSACCGAVWHSRTDRNHRPLRAGRCRRLRGCGIYEDKGRMRPRSTFRQQSRGLLRWGWGGQVTLVPLPQTNWEHIADYVCGGPAREGGAGVGHGGRGG